MLRNRYQLTCTIEQLMLLNYSMMLASGMHNMDEERINLAISELDRLIEKYGDQLADELTEQIVQLGQTDSRTIVHNLK